MLTNRAPVLLSVLLAFACGSELICAAQGRAADPEEASVVITNAADVRSLSPEGAAQGLPVRLRAVATYVFDTHSVFVQDASAGIYVGDGGEFSQLTAGDVVEVEGKTSSGEFAPMVRPTTVTLLAHTNLPTPPRVSYEELMTGREDSQWVQVEGLVRAVFSEPSLGCVLEIASGSGRITAFVPSATEAVAASLVDSQVRVEGVCGTWFNKQRQLFGVRLMVSRTEDIVVVEAAPTNSMAQPAQPIGDLMRFAANASANEGRTKVLGTVILHHPGRALYVQDEEHGLYVQTRQAGRLQPGDRVELLGFPAPGDYTPILQDGIWRKLGGGPPPEPTLVRPDDALGGLYDARLIAIEGRLLDRTYNNNEATLLLEADNHIFSAQLESDDSGEAIMALQNGSRLRLTGVCRIEVGEAWRAGPAWRAKSFHLLLRSPADIQVVAVPPWWTLRRLFWVMGLLLAAVLASLAWATQLRRKVNKQTMFIRRQLEREAKLKDRYQDLFENANDVVYTHALAGQITSINVAGERLLGRHRDAIVGRTILSFLAEEERQPAAGWLERIVDGTAPSTVEWDFINASSGRVRLEIGTRLIERDGKHVEVEGIARDVSERQRLEKEILEISTREQRRIGHDLHDGVCQQLAGIGMLADTLADRLQGHGRSEAVEAHRIAELVNKANKQTRAVARGLFPVRLEENGLVSALEELAENAGTFFKIQCVFDCKSPIKIRDHSVAHHLYYIAQEAILNAVRHGKPRLIQIHLKADAADRCLLTVCDDGRGLTVPSESRGMGLRIMNFRARLIGATVQVRNRDEGGVEVECQFVREAASAIPDHSVKA